MLFFSTVPGACGHAAVAENRASARQAGWKVRIVPPRKAWFFVRREVHDTLRTYRQSMESGMGKKQKKPSFVPIDAADLNPGHRWHRPLQAPGITQVDFEERVDFQRLHRYRLARTRQARAASPLAPLLGFDHHNTPSVPSTVIGESWRPKLLRRWLLTLHA